MCFSEGVDVLRLVEQGAGGGCVVVYVAMTTGQATLQFISLNTRFLLLFSFKCFFPKLFFIFTFFISIYHFFLLEREYKVPTKTAPPNVELHVSSNVCFKIQTN